MENIDLNKQRPKLRENLVKALKVSVLSHQDSNPKPTEKAGREQFCSKLINLLEWSSQSQDLIQMKVC